MNLHFDVQEFDVMYYINVALFIYHIFIFYSSNISLLFSYQDLEINNQILDIEAGSLGEFMQTVL